VAVHVDDGAAWELIDGRVMCVHWRVMKPAVAQAYIEVVEAIFATGKLSAGLWVIAPGMRPPENAVRKRFALMGERGDGLIAGGAFVVPGSSLSTSLVRSVITSVLFLARNNMRTHVAQSVEEGAGLVRAWFADPPASAKNDGYVVDVPRLIAAHQNLAALLDQAK
jgi:hypothetical protein